MKLRRLLDALHFFYLGQHLFQKARLVEQFEGAASVPFGEHLENLFANALAADLRNLWRKLADCGEGFVFDGVAESGCKTHRAQQAQLVLGKSPMRVADGTNHAQLEVFASADEIQNLCGRGIEQKAVDGEVP